MDLTQSKLSRAEWETIEVPVSDEEKQILNMMIQGYHDVNIRTNKNQSMFSFTKVEQSAEMDYLLYKKYLEEPLQNMFQKYKKGSPIADILLPSLYERVGSELKTMKNADMIRIQNLESNIKDNKTRIFEFLLLDLCSDLLKHIQKQKKNYAFYLFTLLQMKKASIRHVNKHLLAVVDVIIDRVNSFTKTSEIITNAYEFIEQNKYLMKYEDRSLFSHQKELFSICRNTNETAKLILYTAPTGTGKTLSPIGLSEGYRVIFVCAARHIGLALAKSAISVEKKVAFAFGCETASDVRLHYFSAIDYTRNRRSGGIGKVDNSVGNNVEIMICDVQSYLVAMHYMLAFNEANQIVTIWDEPTISLDYEEHPLHRLIHRNWSGNKIPVVILSCATLPTERELQPIFNDFRNKFTQGQGQEVEIHTITSFDCRKSIPILNKTGYCVLPHYLYSDYTEMIQCAQYCEENKTLLRYFDLREIIRFIEYVNANEQISEQYSIDSYFNGNITEITMNRLKEYYLDLLLHIDSANWTKIYEYMIQTRKSKFAKTSTGISLTTSDAYTLTDGPTIFLAEDVSKIGTFYIQQTNIDPSVFKTILSKIMSNGEIIQRIEFLEGEIATKESKTTTADNGDKEKSSARESGRLCKESQAWMAEINKLRKQIRLVSLDPMYLPNTRPHQQIWTPTKDVHENAFVSNIGEENAEAIMRLNIDNNLKVLLLLGIGVFMDTPDAKYMEIMKTLADEQRLFIIIASTDYIYGTNYQFCHGFIGKDLARMTQQKTLQAMGRIGRNNIQQDYTIRFRDDDMITQLFRNQEKNLEADNMCILFSSD